MIGRKSFVATLLMALVFNVSVTSAGAVTESEKNILAEVSAYLNSLSSLESQFVQIGPDGEASQGIFHMRRPGRVRFEYEPPSGSLIIADGTWFVVIDRLAKTVDRYPLAETPISFLLEEQVDLLGNRGISEVEKTKDRIRLHAFDENDPANGYVTLIFARNPMTLLQWSVVDAQGLTTTVALSDMRINVKLDPKLFIPPE